MKQDTKETIGSRGTVAGFRPLIGEERWFCDDPSKESIRDGFRPFLKSEMSNGFGGFTNRPLPPPQVETFEAHGHVWYRHVPGATCPVEPDTKVEALLDYELRDVGFFTNCVDSAKDWRWDRDLVGYRFPDFPAVHTTLQQPQPSVQPSTDTQDTTKQRLATMYHGWCDVAPDSVVECIADVAKVLYPTDAERCEAEFQKWLDQRGYPGMDVGNASEAWDAAWNAAKQQKL